MEPILRRSPVVFEEKPVITEDKNGFKVVCEYAGEGDGPWLIDLSHNKRWDIQDKQISDMKPFGLSVPGVPGNISMENGFIVNRLNKTQAAVIHVKGDAPEKTAETMITETTDATVFLALVGNGIFNITEKLSIMDFIDKDKTPPFLIQGPFSHVPCQLMVIERNGNGGVLLLTCSRGYAHDMVEALLHAGKEFGLKPAGENAFMAKLG